MNHDRASNTATVVPSSIHPESYLRLGQLTQIIPFKGPTILKWVRQKRFPPPLKLTSKARMWRAADVFEWLQSLGSSAAFKPSDDVGAAPGSKDPPAQGWAQPSHGFDADGK